MASPRKFSDKLEIIRRKEEEGNAAFVQIMQEVSSARKGPVHAPHIRSHQQNWVPRNQDDFMKMRQIFKGGSLPNVNLSPNPPANHQQRNVSFGDIHFIKDEGSYGSLNDGFSQPQQAYGVSGGGGGGGGGLVRRMDPPSGPIFPTRNKFRSFTSPYRSSLLAQPSLVEEQPETPSLWRRTCSDSAIQQSLQLPPKSNTNGSGSNLLPTSGARIIQSPPNGPMDAQTYTRSPLVSLPYVDSTPTKTYLNIQADTSSLPDLSNLSIPSPIQNPIDSEQEVNNKQREQQNHFQVPYRVPPRRTIGKQMYSRPMNSSTSDIIDSLQHEQKSNSNLYPEISVCSSNVTGSGSNSPITHSVSAPLSPVTPPSFYWNTPISPLATGDMQHSAAPTMDLQQQLFQIQNDNLRNGVGNPNPPPYNNFPSDDESYHSFCSNNYLNDKQNALYRNNSGPAHLSSTNSKTICDHQLESALMRVKAQQGGNDINVSDLDTAILRSKSLHGNELSRADLNSVHIALDPLDFDDVQMLSDNAQIVDQSAEEQFRLERASYQ